MYPLKEIFSSIHPTFKKKKEREYYSGVVKNQWLTNEEAGKSIWPDTPDNNRKVYLSRLKRSVIDRTVTETILTEGKSPYQSAYIDCWRKLAAIRILDGMGVRKGSLWLAKRTLKKAIKYDLTEIIYSLSMVIEINESLSGDPKEFEEYVRISDFYQELLFAENKVVRYFTIISSRFSKSKERGKDLLTMTQKFVKEAEKDLSKFSSFRYIYYTYNLMAIQAQLTNDHKRLNTLCQEVLEIFRQKPYTTPRAVRFSFAFKPISAALQLKDYVSAHNYIEEALSIVEPGSYNRVLCLIYQAILGFHSDQYELVRDAIRRSRAHRKYPAVEEQWKIIEAYADLMDIDTGYKFRMSSFTNAMPIYSKDKRGNNISIIIIQILFLLKTGDRGKIIDKIDALKQYSFRYLRKDETFRSNCFIQMLKCIHTGHFNAISVQRHAAKYTARLGSYQGGEIEIIPFERLWDLVLKLLEQKEEQKS